MRVALRLSYAVLAVTLARCDERAVYFRDTLAKDGSALSSASCADELQGLGATNLVQLRTEARSSRLTTDFNAETAVDMGAAPRHPRMRMAMAALQVHSDVSDATRRDSGDVDCKAHPVYCDPKLNCQNQPPDQLKSLVKRIATADGHANLPSWCPNYPKYEESMKMCLLNGDLKSYAQRTFAYALEYGSDKADASYCYLAGLWNDTSVTETTSLGEMEQICDARYGDAWKKLSLQDLAKAPIDEDTGFKTRRGAEIYAMVACAGGNYHCDVMYCRETYCKKDFYSKQFGHLAFEDPSPRS